MSLVICGTVARVDVQNVASTTAVFTGPFQAGDILMMPFLSTSLTNVVSDTMGNAWVRRTFNPGMTQWIGVGAYTICGGSAATVTVTIDPSGASGDIVVPAGKAWRGADVAVDHFVAANDAKAQATLNTGGTVTVPLHNTSDDNAYLTVYLGVMQNDNSHTGQDITADRGTLMDDFTVAYSTAIDAVEARYEYQEPGTEEPQVTWTIAWAGGNPADRYDAFGMRHTLNITLPVADQDHWGWAEGSATDSWSDQ